MRSHRSDRRRAPVRTVAAALATACALMLPHGLKAQAVSNFDTGAADQPIEIEAESGIEWRRDEKVYVARGNARATRGEFAVNADVLTAHYRESAGGGTKIWRVEAEGRVRLASTNQTIFGDKAVYDLDAGVLRVTGTNLRAETPDQTLTARNGFEYWRDRDVVVARGDATAVRGDQQVKADLLTGYYRKDETGIRHLFQIEATGNVEIRTPAEYTLSEKAVYNLDSRIATLTGGVKITRGRTQLNGERAEVNLNTNVSRIVGSPSSNKRVHTLILPDTKPGADSIVPAGKPASSAIIPATKPEPNTQ